MPRHRNPGLTAALVALLPGLLLISASALAQDKAAEKGPAEMAEPEEKADDEEEEKPPPPPDRVVTNDGSIIFGQVKEMTGGKLKMSAVFDGDIEVKWESVRRLEVNRTIPFVLKDGTILKGKATSPVDNEIHIKGKLLPMPTVVKMGMIDSIDPPARPNATFKGGIAAGGAFNQGNTESRSATGTLGFEAKAGRQRFTASGYFNYGDDGAVVNTRDSRGTMKYDFFLNRRIYTYAGTVFEGDTFKDITLRWIGHGGLGWQIIRDDDFETAPLVGLELAVELGAGYFVEDRRRGEDEAYTTARTSTRLTWPIVRDRLSFFHIHEIYPSLEDRDDVTGTAQTGLRLTFVKNFFGTFQVNHSWDNTPSPGFDRMDILYLWTIGLTFRY